MRAIVIALGAGALATAVLVAPIREALAELARARGEIAALDAPPASVVATESAIASGSQAGASDQLAARLRAVAGAGDVLVERAAPIARAGAARVALRVSGSQHALVAFVDTIERGRPLARFTRWTMRGEGSGVRLTAEVVAPWR